MLAKINLRPCKHSYFEFHRYTQGVRGSALALSLSVRFVILMACVWFVSVLGKQSDRRLIKHRPRPALLRFQCSLYSLIAFFFWALVHVVSVCLSFSCVWNTRPSLCSHNPVCLRRSMFVHVSSLFFFLYCWQATFSISFFFPLLWFIMTLC